MICSFTNCWYPGTFIYPYYSTVQLLYLWDKKVRLSITNAIKCPSLTLFFQTMKNHIQSLLKIVWEIYLEIIWDYLHIKTGLGIKNYFLDPNSDVEDENFFTDFSWQIWAKNTKISLSSESVKTKEHKESNSCEHIISQYMLFTKSICDQFWRSYCKKRFSSFSTFWNFCPYIFLSWNRISPNLLFSEKSTSKTADA